MRIAVLKNLLITLHNQVKIQVGLVLVVKVKALKLLKKILANVEEAIYDRFLYPKERPMNNGDHFFTSAEKLKEFVISYSKLMNYAYKEISVEELKLYGDSV